MASSPAPIKCNVFKPVYSDGYEHRGREISSDIEATSSAAASSPIMRTALHGKPTTVPTTSLMEFHDKTVALLKPSVPTKESITPKMRPQSGIIAPGISFGLPPPTNHGSFCPRKEVSVPSIYLYPYHITQVAPMQIQDAELEPKCSPEKSRMKLNSPVVRHRFLTLSYHMSRLDAPPRAMCSRRKNVKLR